jgi:hypothetical protein
VFAVDLDLDLASKRTSVQTTQIATWVQAERRRRGVGRAAWMADGGGPTERRRSEGTTTESPNQEQGPLVTWGLFK